MACDEMLWKSSMLMIHCSDGLIRPIWFLCLNFNTMILFEIVVHIEHELILYQSSQLKLSPLYNPFFALIYHIQIIEYDFKVSR